MRSLQLFLTKKVSVPDVDIMRIANFLRLGGMSVKKYLNQFFLKNNNQNQQNVVSNQTCHSVVSEMFVDD